MKKIKLKQLRIENFKGIPFLFSDFDCANFNIFGDNATGKTTVYDAFTWLLFGKDSAGNVDSNFNIKPLNSLGEVENHGTVTSVEAIILCDSDEIKFHRTYREKWTCKRGQATEEFNGHELEYFVDDVPVQKREYDAKVAGIIDENIFKILTDVYKFSSLNKNDKRTILFDLGKIKDDAELMKTDARFGELLTELGKLELPDFIKKVSAERKSLSGQRDDLPLKIEENINMRASLSEIDFDGLERQKLENTAVLDELNSKLSAMMNDTISAQSQNKIDSLKNQLNALELENREFRAQQSNGRADTNKLLSTVENLKSDSAKLSAELSVLSQKSLSINRAIGQKRAEWLAENSRVFAENTVCPTCGREFDNEHINHAKEVFEAEKKQKTSWIESQASDLNRQLERLKEDIGSISAKEVDVKQRAEQAEKEYKAALSAEQPIVDMPDYLGQKAKLSEQIAETNAEITKINSDREMSANDLHSQIQTKKAEIEIINRELGKRGIIEETSRRIEELNEHAKTISAKVEQLDKLLFLCGEFTKYKAKYIEESINEKFKYVKFKLFDTQINGAIVDCCDITIGGVPYVSLNNAAKINAGIDIINTLSDFYGVSVPLFVDNAESVTQVFDIKTQVIKLVVNESDKKLRFERV